MNGASQTAVERAKASKGGSSEAIYRMVVRVLSRRHRGGGTLLDVGCGRGELREYVAKHINEYIGADVIRYDLLPVDASFVEIDLDAGRVPLPNATADVVAAVETIEHLENPRAFVRELHRLVKPGGLVLVTTPNQLSFLSLFTLLTKHQFNAFQESPGLYPAHITALLESDLKRIFTESGLREAEIAYSNNGRVPLSNSRWPSLPGFRGRRFSDNILLSGRASSTLI